MAAAAAAVLVAIGIASWVVVEHDKPASATVGSHSDAPPSEP
jgi:hypothetical protein